MLENTDTSRAYGNEEVVHLLEVWLERAKEGKICHATITAQQMPNLMACDFAGSADLEFAIPYALDTLKIKMAEVARMHTRPRPVDNNLGADYVCYNIANCPLSFDFLPWLIDAEMTRVREDAPAPLKVGFSMGQDGKTGLNTALRRQMFTGVVRPLLHLLGAVEDQQALAGRAGQWHVLRDVTAAARRGEPVPKLRASSEAGKVVASFLRDSPPPVTITLREQEVWSHRNSNMEAWLKFADDLGRKGERVLWVRDTAKAGEPLLGRDTTPIASVNLDVRTALYERAKCNLFVPTGPWNVALFGDEPWLVFNEVTEEDPYACNRPSFWRDSQGIEVGDQFPWQGLDQCIVWARDDYHNICQAWEALS